MEEEGLTTRCSRNGTVEEEEEDDEADDVVSPVACS